MEAVRKRSYHLIYFFLQPFFTVIYYTINFRKPAAKNIMWLFTSFFGATFAVGKESENSDINRYIEEITLINNLDLNFNLKDFLFYYQSTGEFDVLRSILAFITSLFTDNGYYLIVVFSIIFGYFFSRNIWYVLDRLEGRLKPFTVFLIFCLFLAIPIWNINTFRFWLGAHVFIYGLLPFFFEGKKKPLFWCFITPFLIHYSFLSALVPLLAYLILGNRIRLYYGLFVFSLLFNEVDIQYFNKLVENYAPTALVERSSSYRTDDKVEELRTGEGDVGKVWYAKYYTEAGKYVLVIFVFVFYWVYKRRQIGNEKLFNLFSFVLLFFAFANVFSSIPSGYRFINVSNLLTLCFLSVYYQNNKVHQSIKNVASLTWPILLLHFLVILRISLYSVSLMTLVGNPLLAIYSFGENIALNDIIKGL